MTYASNNNAVLIDGCQNLENLSVLLQVTEDVKTTTGGGWSLQLNCYPPAGEYCQASQVNIFQYIVYVQGGNLRYELQYWAGGASTWPPGFTPQPGTTPWLPCWPNDYYLSAPFANINGDTLPRESELQIALTTNRYGGVTKVTFSYTDPDGDVHSAEFDPPAVHPIVAFELNFVGPGGSANANFTQGLLDSRGIIYYSITSGQLSVQNGGPGSACGEAGFFTAETSNMTYSDISGAPAGTVTQILQQPVDCSIDDLFRDERSQVDRLQEVRDRLVVHSHAGQWVLEILNRHAADLAVLFASDEEIASRARELLTEASHIAREERAFDDEIVDRALALLRRITGSLPPSMMGASAAGETVLTALRGATLEEGLRAASATIRPRSHPPERRDSEPGERRQ